MLSLYALDLLEFFGRALAIDTYHLSLYQQLHTHKVSSYIDTSSYLPSIPSSGLPLLLLLLLSTGAATAKVIVLLFPVDPINASDRMSVWVGAIDLMSHPALCGWFHWRERMSSRNPITSLRSFD